MERWTGRESRSLRHALRMSVREFAGLLGVSDRLVSRWEAAGSAMVPRPVNQAALDTMLDGADARSRERFFTELSGTIESRATSSESEEDVRRREFLHLAAVAATGALIPHAATAGEASDVIGAIAGPTAHYRRLEQTFPSAPLADAVHGHATLAQTLVRRIMPTPAGYAALSELAGLAAWLSVDQGNGDTARGQYLAAVAHAERAGHDLLAAYMRASLGAYATEAGDPKAGLGFLQQARTQFVRDMPPAAHAWLAANLAVTHATLGDHKTARTELRASQRLATAPTEEPVWPWVFTFDHTKAARYGAATLGMLGDITGARESFALAAPALTAPKARALAQGNHAIALADAGHVAEACNLATAALGVGNQLGSERVVQRVRTFRAGLPRHAQVARELDEAMADLYRDTGGEYAPGP